MDSRKCQTSTASPAKPGGLPFELVASLRWAAAPEAGRTRPPVRLLLWMLVVAGAMVTLPIVMAHLSAGATLTHAGVRGVPFSTTRLFLFFLKVGSVL